MRIQVPNDGVLEILLLALVVQLWGSILLPSTWFLSVYNLIISFLGGKFFPSQSKSSTYLLEVYPTAL